jgi:hypothetical protein
VTPTPTRTTPTVTPSRTPTATITPTVTGTTTATATPTVTATPRKGPDVQRVYTAFKATDKYRVHLTGPNDVQQEIGGPDRMRIVVRGPVAGEFFLRGTDLYQKVGSVWRRVQSAAPSYVVDRIAGRIDNILGLRGRTFAFKGITRVRAGDCELWEVLDNRPDDPIDLCIQVSDGPPFRLRYPDGSQLELWDYGVVELTDPFPIQQ